MQMNPNTSLGQADERDGRRLLQNPDSITEPAAFPRHPGRYQVQQPFPNGGGGGGGVCTCLVKDPQSQRRKEQLNPVGLWSGWEEGAVGLSVGSWFRLS